jgi:GAF domain-containing protein
MVQLVAEHARELTAADCCAVRLRINDDTPTIEALATDGHETALESHVTELSSLYRALAPPTGSLRMTATELERHREAHVLTTPEPTTGRKPRAWLAAALTTLDGRHLGLIHAFDKQTGDFSELDEAILVQLAQMASAAVERAQLYRGAPE